MESTVAGHNQMSGSLNKMILIFNGTRGGQSNGTGESNFLKDAHLQQQVISDVESDELNYDDKDKHTIQSSY